MSSGKLLWNSGMFAWSVRTIRAEIAQHVPALHSRLQELAALTGEEEFADRLTVIFPSLPKISIDYGVMERFDKVFVVLSDLHWDDLGGWTAVGRLRKADQDGNVVKGLVVTEDCTNILVESKGRLVAALGVSNLIVVETDDAVLVCARDRAQDIRRLAVKVQETLAARQREGDRAAGD